MIKIRNYWFKDEKWLEPYCPTGKCPVASRQCHDCPMCLKIDSVNKEVSCGENVLGMYNEVPFEKLQVGDRFRLHPTLEEPIYTVIEKQAGVPCVQSNVTVTGLMKYSGNVFVIKD